MCTHISLYLGCEEDAWAGIWILFRDAYDKFENTLSIVTLTKEDNAMPVTKRIDRRHYVYAYIHNVHING